MKNNAFFSQIRQYASLARRTGQSYAAAVNEVKRLRAETIRSEISDPQKAEAEVLKMHQAVSREYAPYDPKWNEEREETPPF